jgi:Restriction Endonuclease associating with ARP
MMGKFLESEKPEQEKFKATAPYFSDAARAVGYYKGASRRFCLPRENADENLFPAIRQPIRAYFCRNEIKWHDGHDRNPSNHLCDSQVCCANFLFPFFDKPEALVALLRPIFPDLKEMLPIEDGQTIAFEWIGQKDYLGEKKPNKARRTRGALSTSADAAVMFSRMDGKKQIVLIEWKYTESYYPTWLKTAPSGTERAKIYAHLYEADDCPITKELIPSFDSLFYEPFYQLMRQQFLANEMEKAHEKGADIVSLLHVSPAHNQDFMRVTSPDLRGLGSSPTRVWQKLVIKPDRFAGVYSENLFGNFNVGDFPELEEWWRYITMRYDWVVG